jgi:hypothetical protein
MRAENTIEEEEIELVNI